MSARQTTHAVHRRLDDTAYLFNTMMTMTMLTLTLQVLVTL